MDPVYVGIGVKLIWYLHIICHMSESVAVIFPSVALFFGSARPCLCAHQPEIRKLQDRPAWLPADDPQSKVRRSRRDGIRSQRTCHRKCVRKGWDPFRSDVLSM
ncbi:hypothetical protein FA95DRAFT_1001354 [Auriscalpium vulgare]|uniref:Uncharacterized protein n=1 Tax=Auriscalpium vulgare TaxID=40419 RepID=A0ACB8R6X6_9AGAM|nr:hypothetical protein FA95DRAFT_1001354 [Auriscalpium vulgare]